MSYKLSKYIHVVKDNEINPGKTIVFATRSCAVVEIADQHFEALTKSEFSVLPLKTLKKLMDYLIIVPAEEDELKKVLEENKAGSKDKRSLSFTIQPTANCQLGCHYCAQSHSKKVMNVDVANLMIDRIRQKIINNENKYDALYITWYGGEPLTGLSSIEYSSLILQQLANENNLKYRATMISNGLALKPKLFEHLVEDHKVYNFQITLDGTKEFHDNRRMLKNGAPSFDIIFDNICSIALSDFYKSSKALISIRCNVNSENKENVFALMDLLKEKNIHDKVDFKIAKVENWGGNQAGTKEMGGMDKDEFAQLEIEVMLKQVQEGFKLVGNVLPTRRTDVCMVTSASAEVIDGFGNVSTCWEVPYTPLSKKAGFVAGNLSTDPDIDSSNVAMRKWFDEIPVNESWCKGCKFLPVCGGSCPKAWYEGTPACPSFKFNMDERIFMKKFKMVP
jgi:uncharacterized protein